MSNSVRLAPKPHASFTHPASDMHPVGCDDGHFGIKVCAGPDTFFTLLSRADNGRKAIASLSGGNDEDLVYETADGEFVTITADHLLGDAVDTRTTDYPTSSPNRALVVHAMRKAGVTGDVFLVTGLPVNRFYTEGSRNNDLIEAKRQSLLRPVICMSGVDVPCVKTHMVLSEAVAAYYDKRYDFNGQEDEEFVDLSNEEAIAVVDVGGRTLDIATIKEGGGGLYQAQSGTADVGALYLYDELEKALRREFGRDDDIPFNRLQRTLVSGEYRLYNTKHDVSPIVNELLDGFAERIHFESAKLLGDASRFGQVLFVGGGAALMKDRLHLVFPNLPEGAITYSMDHDNPRVNAAYANARGMYKCALVQNLALKTAE